MHAEAIIGGHVGGRDWAHQISEIVVTMLPEILDRGIASAIDPEALEAGMMRDIEAGAVIEPIRGWCMVTNLRRLTARRQCTNAHLNWVKT
ncbi:hypothetical protein BBX50_25500 [Ensifer sp. LC11]|nr:hypothetical protein BBX50_25500 [Ensifer sp. LC11]